MYKLTIDLLERVCQRYSVNSSGCWVWSAGLNSKGYAQITLPGRAFSPVRPTSYTVRAMRLLFTVLRGAIPDGLHLDHLCKNRACVNPDHLEAVTPRENVLRSAPATKTSCVNGHPLEGDNLYSVARKGTGHPKRGCKSCRHEAVIKHRNKVRILK